MRFASRPIRQLVAALLTFCVSVCCCQAHYLMHGLSGCDAPIAEAVADATPSCCKSGETPAPPCDEEAPAPVKGCQTCCIKGSGLKDNVVVPPSVAVAMLPAFALPVSAVAPLADGCDRVHRVDRARLRVASPTLLSLHCALLL